MSYKVAYFDARVRGTIESWPVGLLAGFARTLELLMEFGPALRMPHSRALGGGLFELRFSGREGSGRAFYCYAPGEKVIILHAMAKSTRATPARDLRVARARMKEVSRG